MQLDKLKLQFHMIQSNQLTADLPYEADVPLSQIGRIERGENNPTLFIMYVLNYPSCSSPFLAWNASLEDTNESYSSLEPTMMSLYTLEPVPAGIK